MQNLVTGNLGLSLEYQRPNVELIGERLALTVVLAAMAFIVTWVVAIPAGIYSATHPGSPLDYVFTVLNYVGVATPNFMLALVLMWMAFAYFGMSITGLFSPEYVEAPWSFGRVGNLLAHIWLPAVVLGVAGTARLTRVHARQPARRAAQAVRHHRAGQGALGVAARAALSGAAGAESADQHDRLVSAGAVLRQPHRGHRR